MSPELDRLRSIHDRALERMSPPIAADAEVVAAEIREFYSALPWEPQDVYALDGAS